MARFLTFPLRVFILSYTEVEAFETNDPRDRQNNWLGCGKENITFIWISFYLILCKFLSLFILYNAENSFIITQIVRYINVIYK